MSVRTAPIPLGGAHAGLQSGTGGLVVGTQRAGDLRPVGEPTDDGDEPSGTAVSQTGYGVLDVVE